MENYSEKIQEYIEGQLEGDELLQFEAQLVVDEELRNLLSLQKEVHDILIRRVMSKDMELRGIPTQEENNFRHNPNEKVINIRRIVTILIVLSILFIGSLFLFNGPNDLYTLPDMNSEEVRGEEVNIVYEEAVKAFNNKDYGVASYQLESLAKAEPNEVQYQYYLGLAYLGEDKWNDAIAILRPIALGESVFAKEAIYFLALAYYKSNNNVEAVSLLRQIATEEGVQGIKAKRLLEEIN